MLSYCYKCGEMRAVIKVYTRKRDGECRRVMYCLSKGCGMAHDITYSKIYANMYALKQQVCESNP